MASTKILGHFSISSPSNSNVSTPAIPRTSSLSFPYRLLFPPPPPPPPPPPTSFSSTHLADHDQALVENNTIKNRKQLRELSTFGIGGPCRYFIEVDSSSHLASAVKFCRARSIPLIVVGKGSNCLFSDQGFDGMVVLNRLEQGRVQVVGPGTYRVGSGYPFSRLGVRCSADGFGGLEFAGGIPGTVGGATFMNAGANGQEEEDSTNW